MRMPARIQHSTTRGGFRSPGQKLQLHLAGFCEMPKAAEKIGVIGNSEVSVEMHGHLANGMDALEVVDIEKAFESKTTEESTDTPEGPESAE